jgi:hypothetical protein
MNESVRATYCMGPGSNAPGRKRLNAKLSCSNTDTVPSMDWTQKKSLPVGIRDGIIYIFSTTYVVHLGKLTSESKQMIHKYNIHFPIQSFLVALIWQFFI